MKAERYWLKNRLSKDPPGAVRVVRPRQWGNPFKIPAGASESLRVESVRRHREWVLCQLKHGALDVKELRGKKLACTCRPDAECHSGTLVELANLDSPTLEALVKRAKMDYPPMHVKQVDRHTIPGLITKIGKSRPDWPYL